MKEELNRKYIKLLLKIYLEYKEIEDLIKDKSNNKGDIVISKKINSGYRFTVISEKLEIICKKECRKEDIHKTILELIENGYINKYRLYEETMEMLNIKYSQQTYSQQTSIHISRNWLFFITYV